MVEALKELAPFLLIAVVPLFSLLGVLIGARLAIGSQEKVAALERRHQLSMATLEERLKAHQGAYSLWRKLEDALHDPKIRDVVFQCQEWWKDHCLYLTAEAREAFVNAYWAAHNHANLIETWKQSRKSEDSASVRENWEVIRRLGPVLERAMELPNLTAPQLPTGGGPFGDA